MGLLPGLFAVAAGAVLGAWARWGLGIALNAIVPNLPLGTLTANLVGGYIIGVSVEFFLQHASVPAEWRLFVITGFLGGLTTFSTFSAEAVELLSRGQPGWFCVHVSAHLVGSLLLTVLGIYTVRVLHA